MTRLLAILSLCFATSASANVWDRAANRGAEAAQDQYDKSMREADDAILLANTRSASRPLAERELNLGLRAYHDAAIARPEASEPYFRIIETLNTFYFGLCSKNPRILGFNSPLCDPDKFNLKRADELIAAISELEKRSPLDPRLCNSFGGDLWFDRAIANTRFGTDARLALAAEDYERLINCKDGSDGDLDTVWSNLAETYMMLGRLTDSIVAYREAARRGGNVSTHYGLAVALDRDDSPMQARDVILAQGEEGFTRFMSGVFEKEYFYVPDGEVFYYTALAQETWGHPSDAITAWKRFIQSGAHPQFQARAKAHLDALLKHPPPRPLPPPVDPIDLFP
jgi:tetratricopeptide (TPR) repeat protein